MSNKTKLNFIIFIPVKNYSFIKGLCSRNNLSKWKTAVVSSKPPQIWQTVAISNTFPGFCDKVCASYILRGGNKPWRI